MTKQEIKDYYESNDCYEYRTGGGFMAMSLQGKGENQQVFALIADRDDCHMSYTDAVVSIGIYDDVTGDPLTESLVDCYILEAPARAAKLLKEYVINKDRNQ